MYIFIGGIPASGKSYLAKKISDETGAFVLDLDTVREEMSKDSKLEYWVNFFFKQDEEKYLIETSCEEHWQNLVKQSEAFWPTILSKVKEVMQSHKSAIFEGVNILPHLAAKDLQFPGIILVGNSLEDIFERNKKEPRWGKTEELQRKEAEAFYYCKGPKYEREAKKYGFETFTDQKLAEKKLLEYLER